MSISLALPHRIRWGLTAAASTAMLALLVVLASLSATGAGTSATASSDAASGIASTPLVQLAAEHPGRSVEAIVQFENGVSPATRAQARPCERRPRHRRPADHQRPRAPG